MSTEVSEIKQPIEIVFQGESLGMGVAKVDIDGVNLPLKTKKE